LNICEELLLRLERFLLSRQMAVQHVLFSFFHLQVPATHISLGCVAADRAVQHWSDLLKIKFDQLVFPAAAIAVQLRAGRARRFSAETEILPFNEQVKRPGKLSIAHLAERLSARIGEEAVHGVMTVAEHRPQYAWRRQDVGVAAHGANVPNYHAEQLWNPSSPRLLEQGLLDEIQRNVSLILRRPLWMLQEPKLLRTEQNLPLWEGALQLLDGPERLETGWWDDDGIARDYFVARNPKGVHLWVYRNRKGKSGRRWFLHGIFG